MANAAYERPPNRRQTLQFRYRVPFAEALPPLQLFNVGEFLDNIMDMLMEERDLTNAKRVIANFVDFAAESPDTFGLHWALEFAMSSRRLQLIVSFMAGSNDPVVSERIKFLEEEAEIVERQKPNLRTNLNAVTGNVKYHVLATGFQCGQLLRALKAGVHAIF